MMTASMTRVLATAVGALALSGALAGCGGTVDPAGGEQSPPAGVEVTTGTSTDGLEEGSEDGLSATLSGVTVVCPDGWTVTGDTGDDVSVAQTPGEGAIDIVLRPTSDMLPDAQGWADSVADTTGIDGSAETREVNGVTWYGVVPDDSSFILYADNPAEPGTVVSVTGEGISLEDALEMLEGITVG